MDVKQEPLDLNEVYFKTEPEFPSSQPVETDWCYRNREAFKTHHENGVNMFEFQSTGQFENLNEVKQELKCEVPKIEQLFDLPTKNDHDDSLYENTQNTFPVNVKTEIDVDKVKTDLLVDICDIKHEIRECVQTKTESELLTSFCDLPTLKNENVDYPDYFEQPCSSKQTERIVKSLKNTKKRKRKYPCPVCEKNCPSSTSRLNHVDGHFRKRCVIYCPSSTSRLNHVDEHYRKRSVICKFCGNFFTTKIEFLKHYFIHSVKNKRINVIKKYEESVGNESNIPRSSIIHSNKKPIKCYLCYKKFKDESNLHKHFIIHAKEKPYKCDICSKNFNYKSNLTKHLMIHTKGKSFKCDICFKNFNYKSSLQRHSIIHGNEEPYKCGICSKKFTQKSGLKDHLMIHTNEKPFKCDICSDNFKLKGHLQRHLISHNKEKPFNCDVCFKKFQLKSYLTKHLSIHTDRRKPFRCDICSQQFCNNWSLRQHVMIHSDEKSFKCKICSKKFTRKSYLQRHLRIHNDNKPFKCEICSRQFRIKTALTRHLKIHTQKQRDIKNG